MGRLAGAASKLGDVVFYLRYVPLAIILYLATCVGRAILWFQRHVYWRNAPFRIVRGPYLLVLRSFSNRMATTKRVTRVILTPDGQEVTVPEFGKGMPDLTVIRFLKHVAQHARQPLVGVSNGASLDGALRLVHSPQERWFDAVRILATHARAILVIPDNSPALVREIAHSWRLHPSKLAILMPPSDDRTERVRELMKLYRVEGVDLSSVWADTKRDLAAVGVDLPDYEHHGGIVIRDKPEPGASEAVFRRLPWHPDVLMAFLDELQSEPSDAGAARADLRAAGLRMLRYEAPEGTELDPSWNRFPFHPQRHLDRLTRWAQQKDASGPGGQSTAGTPPKQ